MQTRMYCQPNVKVMIAKSNLAIIVASRKRWKEARTALEQALHECDSLIGEDHPYRATIRVHLAGVLEETGHFPEGARLRLEALNMRRRLFPADQAAVARDLTGLAFLLERLGDAPSAEPLYRDAAEMYKRLYPGNHADVASALSNLAYILATNGHPAKAEEICNHALDMRNHIPGLPDHVKAGSYMVLAYIYRIHGRPDLAQAHARRSVRMRRDPRPDGANGLAASLTELGLVLADLNQIHKARVMFMSPLCVVWVAPGPRQPERGGVCHFRTCQRAERIRLVGLPLA